MVVFRPLLECNLYTFASPILCFYDLLHTSCCPLLFPICMVSLTLGGRMLGYSTSVGSKKPDFRGG